MEKHIREKTQEANFGHFKLKMLTVGNEYLEELSASEFQTQL